MGCFYILGDGLESIFVGYTHLIIRLHKLRAEHQPTTQSTTFERGDGAGQEDCVPQGLGAFCDA